VYLIQLLLPLYDNEREPFGREAFDHVRDELMQRFGGVTAFRHAPAEGVWQAGEGSVSRDAVITFEVMSEQLDRAWWARYRGELEARFRQEVIVVRSIEAEQL
jgi:hypothetical protein